MSSTARLLPLCAALGALAGAGLAQQNVIAVPDSSSDVIVLLDPFDGSVLDPAFIENDMSGLNYSFSTVKEVVQVNNELWTFDQTEEIVRFDLAGNFIAMIDGTTVMLDNVRGAAFANNTVYVCSDGTNNGAPGNSIVMFDTSGNRLGDFPVGTDPFDVVEFNGELLVSDFTEDNVVRYDYTGMMLGTIVDTAANLNYAEQVSPTAAGTLYVVGFQVPSGVYEYDTTGTELNFYATGGLLRGATQLGNGNILVCGSTGTNLSVFDPVMNTTTTLLTGTGWQYASHVQAILGGSDPFPDVCNGDGGDQLGCTDCPCGNNATAGSTGGCLNSSGNGSALDASGDPSVSLPSGDTTDLRFTMSGGPAVATSVLLSGDAVAPTNMANPCFGLDSGAQSIDRDGLRCAVQNVQRHGNRQTNAAGDILDSTGPNRVWGGEAQPTAGIAGASGFAAGQTRYFQVTHRDDPALVCMRGLNTSQAVQVTFTP